jgi:hypothetical protein
MGISTASLWDIECIDDELTIYSPTQIRRFCQVLGVSRDGGKRRRLCEEVQAPAQPFVSLARPACEPKPFIGRRPDRRTCPP